MSVSGGQEAAGLRLRQARLAALMTLEELADTSGVSVRAISDLERGRTGRPYPRTVRLLTDALGLRGSAGGDLALLARPTARGTASGARSPATELPPAVPAQLPPVTRLFSGRMAELATLTSWLEETASGAGSVMITAICGTAGVGKTALALRWAHQIASLFPDGQLYVNLRGFSPSGPPATPAQAIRGFLDALQVPADQIPADPEALAGAYRGVLAGRRMLVILDNAGDDAQVRPLLPVGPGCLVVVTSRCQLGGLAAIEGAHLLALDVLTEADARELLTARLGARRASAEPEAVDELTGLCARLPLAVSIIAARAASRPSFPLAALTAELRNIRHRLDALDAGEVTADVRAVLSWSSRRLSPTAARMFRLLGLHPGPDISIPAAASLAGLTRRQARAALAELSRDHMITEHAPGRFTSHDLLRAYAAELASDLPEAEQRAAMHRTLDHYLHTAAAATALLLDQIDPIASPPPAVPGTVTEELSGGGGAFAWFEAERLVLSAVIGLAVEFGSDAHAWHLPEALREFYVRRAYWHDCAAAQRIALAAVVRTGGQAVQATAHRHLAAAQMGLGLNEDAQAELAAALELYRSLGDQQGEGRIHFQMARICCRRDDYHGAVIHGRQARRLARSCGQPADEAHALNTTGWFHALLGNHRLARAYCERALSMHRQVGSKLGEALTLQVLSVMNMQAGRHQQAITLLRQAMDACRETGFRFYYADMLDDLGDAYHAANDLLAARDSWRLALAIFEELRHPRASQSRGKLITRSPATRSPPR